VEHKGTEEEAAQLWYDHIKWVFTNGLVYVQCGGVSHEYKYRLLETRPLLVITDLSWKVYKGTVLRRGYYHYHT